MTSSMRRNPGHCDESKTTAKPLAVSDRMGFVQVNGFTTSLPLTARTRNAFEKLAAETLEFLPMTTFESDLGLGRGLFFPMPLKHKPEQQSDFIYVITESYLPIVPADLSLGFTEDDVIEFVGVRMFRKLRGRFVGETF